MNTKLVALACVSAYVSCGYACMFTIENDTKHTIFVTNSDRDAVFIKPGATGEINPHLHGRVLSVIPRRLLVSEKLSVYVQAEKNRFVRTYDLIEKYCESDAHKNRLKMSDIRSPLPAHLQERFTIVESPR